MTVSKVPSSEPSEFQFSPLVMPESRMINAMADVVQAKSRWPKVPPLRRLVALAAGTYLAVALGVAVFQTSLIYYPTRLIEATPADVGLEFEDLTITTSDGVPISAWFVPHSAAKATVLFFHGNGGNISHRIQEIRTLNGLGFSVLMVDYRGYGLSGGRPTERGTYLDADASWEYLTTTRGRKAASIVIFGESLGGAVAIDLASRHNPGALVVQSSFTKLADVAAIHYPFLPVRWLLRHEYDSISKVGRIGCPKLFIHSTEDSLIPLSIGQALFDAASEPKRQMLTPGDHNGGGFLYSHQTVAEFGALLDSIGGW